MEDLQKYKVPKGGQYLDEDKSCQKLRIRKKYQKILEETLENQV